MPGAGVPAVNKLRCNAASCASAEGGQGGGHGHWGNGHGPGGNLFDIELFGRIQVADVLPNMPQKRKPAAIGVLSSHLGFHLRMAQLAVFQDIGDALKEIDLTPGVFSVLEVLSQNEGITQSRLAAAVRLERSSVVPLLDKLAQRGLVERRASTTDRRQNHLHLTKAGRALLEEALRRAAAHERQVSKPFTAAEKKQLLEFLGRLRHLKPKQPA